MKNIGIATINLFLAMILTSCNTFSAPSTTIGPTDPTGAATSIVFKTFVVTTQPALPPITSLPQTEAPVPTSLNTPLFPSTPTDTSTATSIPTTATVTTEPVPHTSFGAIFMTGTDRTGGYLHAYPDDIFHLFPVTPDELDSFHFAMLITAFHFTKSELTPTPTAIPTAKWQLLISRYRPDGIYTNQPVFKTNFVTAISAYPDRLSSALSAKVKMKDLQAKFGDCRVFTFQVSDEHGDTQQQGSFSINPHYLFFYEGSIKGNMKNGITIGYPYSLHENETEFFHQDRFVTIRESQGGFYRLSYWFDFVTASGVSATIEQEEVASKLSIRLFPYREDENYSLDDSQPLTGFIHAVGGYFIVDLPIDDMRANIDNENKYYLQITDGNGKIIKDEYFLFIPYTP